MPVLVPGMLEALGLYLVRTSAMVLASPVFLMGAGFAGYKIALIAILSAVLYGATGAPLAGDVDGLMFGAMAVRELLIGFSIGFVVQLGVLAVKVAGQLVGHEMGFAIAGQIDPDTGVQVPLITRVWESVFLIGFLSVNGHHLLIRALTDSFRASPVGQIEAAQSSVGVVRALFSSMFQAGLTFAAPVMLLLALVSLLIGVLTRAVPYLNVLEMSFTMRVGLGLLSIFLFAPLLGPILDNLYTAMGLWLERGVLALEAD